VIRLIAPSIVHLPARSLRHSTWGEGRAWGEKEEWSEITEAAIFRQHLILCGMSLLPYTSTIMERIATINRQTVAFAILTLTLWALASSSPALAQIGRRFPSEKKIVPDPVTGVPLSFLTSTPAGDAKIYQTHPQWTADGKWLIFRSGRAAGQAFAVNEETGDIVQVTENGFTGMLCVAQKSMRLIHMRPVKPDAAPLSPPRVSPAPAPSTPVPAAPVPPTPMTAPATPSTGSSASPIPTPTPNPQAFEIVAIELAKVFADSKAGTMKPAAEYEHVFGTIPAGMATQYELALDATEEVAYFCLTREEAAKHVPPGMKLEAAFGARKWGRGPMGIGSMNLKTGEVKVVVATPFQVGHIQTNPWVPGEIVLAWETAGKSPQRTWTVMADGTGLRPLYPEAAYDWVTHEAVITKDEVAFAIMGHRKLGANDAWGPSGTREHATGLGIVNLRTREFYIAAQTKSGSGLWHVHGSPDGRWAVGDDFTRNLYLIDRHTNEMMLLSTGHKETAADHPHPTFSPDGTRIQIQSAMLSEDNRSMNICVIPVPGAWLKRTYGENANSAHR
jgi:oligogalacturonide lyase